MFPHLHLAIVLWTAHTGACSFSGCKSRQTEIELEEGIKEGEKGGICFPVVWLFF